MDDSQSAHGAKAKVQELDEGLGLHHPKEQLAYIGRRIRQLRLEQGYSQEGFALRVGLARSYYGALERGERNFSVDHLLRIARGLGVEAGVLLPPLSSLISADQAVAQGGEQQVTEQVIAAQRTQDIQGTQEGQAVNVASYVSAGAAAKILGVNRRTVARWVAEGVLDALLVEDSNGRLVAVFQRETLRKNS
jgi:transcriptional regulator with XRE-family HTH domain